MEYSCGRDRALFSFSVAPFHNASRRSVFSEHYVRAIYAKKRKHEESSQYGKKKMNE